MFYPTLDLIYFRISKIPGRVHVLTPCSIANIPRPMAECSNVVQEDARRLVSIDSKTSTVMRPPAIVTEGRAGDTSAQT